MKRNLTLLTILGALIALAVPASSMASMYPAGHKFEITGNANGPKITTSLGSCPITKITGTIPAAPKNEELGTFAISTPTVGTCSSGASLTLSGTWQMSAVGYVPLFYSTGTSEAGVMRFSSLPGCKLVSGSLFLSSTWSNGTTTPTLLKSGFYAHSEPLFTWANDGGSCALAGTKENVKWESASGQSQVVTDLTSPTTPIIIGNDK
jgi:hypothetical protein